MAVLFALGSSSCIFGTNHTIMINIQELRLNNWIDFTSTPGNYEQVKDIQTYDMKTPSVNRVAVSDVVPIPLDKVWIERFGFEWIDTHWSNNGRVSLYITADYECIFNNLLSVKLSYVHQLQNLYFALTGQELTIK